MTRSPLPPLLANLLNALTAYVTLGVVAYGRESIPLANPFGGDAWPGAAAVSTPSDLLDDPFTYNPDLNYANYSSVPAGFLPDTPWNGGDTVFIANNDDASNYWGADVTLTAGQTLDFLDIWGRTDYAGAEQSRHQNLVINFYNAPGGSAGGGTLLGASGEYSGVTPKAAGNPIGSAYGRFDVNSVLNATQRAQVQSIEISHGPTNLSDFLLFAEVRAGTGAAAPSLPVLTINRSTGAASIYNGPATPLNFISYSITSASGALKETSWTSVADTGDGDSGGSIDSDIWIEFSAAGATDNLSEGEQPGGNGLTLNTGQSLNLGNIWTRNPREDVAIELLKADGTNAPAIVEFTENGGSAFELGDLTFDGSITPADWPIFRNGMGSTFTGVPIAQTYGSGDFDGDLDVDITDFRTFEKAYDAVNGVGAFVAMASGVPEPTGLALMAGGAWALVAARRRRRKAVLNCLCVVACLAAAGVQSADAQTFTLIPTPTGPVTANSEFNGDYVASNLFDDNSLTAADLGVKLFNQDTGQYAGVGVGPMEVFIDNGASVTTNWIAYAQRLGGIADADRVGKIEVWFSNADFGGALPATPAQATANIGDPLSNIIYSYPLLTSLSGRYAALRLTIADVSAAGTINNIGGHEFRFIQGPAPLTLQVNTNTGAMTLKNVPGSFAQAVALDGYQISSTGGSLSTTWSGLGGLPGFLEGNGTGDGWEAGGGSSSRLLTEAYLLGGSTVSLGASLNLGHGYNTAVNAQDLKFMYSYDNSVFTAGLVEYVSTDFDNDGDADGKDFLAWQRGVGINSGATKAQGDADGNGAVNGADLAIWKTGFAASAPSAVAVPEPASWSMLAAGGVALFAQLRRKRAMAWRRNRRQSRI